MNWTEQMLKIKGIFYATIDFLFASFFDFLFIFLIARGFISAFYSVLHYFSINFWKVNHLLHFLSSAINVTKLNRIIPTIKFLFFHFILWFEWRNMHDEIVDFLKEIRKQKQRWKTVLFPFTKWLSRKSSFSVVFVNCFFFYFVFGERKRKICLHTM